MIHRFLKHFPPFTKWFHFQVTLILGIYGECTRTELKQMRNEDLDDTGNCIIVKVPDLRNKSTFFRVFIIQNNDSLLEGVNVLELIRKYRKLRPPHTYHMRFLLSYRMGKCSSSPLGVNSIGNFPKRIASLLKLPNPELYCGMCFQKTSSLFLGNNTKNKSPIPRNSLSIFEQAQCDPLRKSESIPSNQSTLSNDYSQDDYLAKRIMNGEDLNFDILPHPKAKPENDSDQPNTIDSSNSVTIDSVPLSPSDFKILGSKFNINNPSCCTFNILLSKDKSL